MDISSARTILYNAIETTKPRWSQYSESWENIDTIFIIRGYEQQGFQLFKMQPLFEEAKLLSIDKLGSILLKYPGKRNYERQFAGSLTSELYLALRKGTNGRDGELFVTAVQTFLDQKIGNPGRTFWKLLYQMLQGCAFLKQHYNSSFAKYIMSKYAYFTNKKHLTETEFLNTSPSEWESFLTKTKPWGELMGIGPNVFDFLFGDIKEAQFAVNSYKFDSSNQHFLNTTGIAKLIVPFDRFTTTHFLRDLNIPFSLREINKGVYTFCSKTEGMNYGYCRDQNKCNVCHVKNLCDKNFKPTISI